MLSTHHPLLFCFFSSQHAYRYWRVAICAHSCSLGHDSTPTALPLPRPLHILAILIITTLQLLSTYRGLVRVFNILILPPRTRLLFAALQLLLMLTQ